LLLVVLAWSFEYIFMKISADAISPLTAGAIMFFTGGMLLFFHLILRRELHWKQIVKNAVPLITIGFVGVACNVLLLFGVSLTPTINAAVLGKSDVLFSLLLSFFISHASLRKSAVLFISLMLIRIFILGSGETMELNRSGRNGDWLILGSACLLSVNLFIIKKAVVKSGVALLRCTNCLINAVVFAVLCFVCNVTDDFSKITIGTPAALISADICVYLFFIGYYQAFKYLPIWGIRILMLAIPIVIAIAGVVFLGEYLFGTTVRGDGTDPFRGGRSAALRKLFS